MAKILSWNVNGIRACFKNGFLDWFHAQKPDVVGLQEVRAEPHQVPKEILDLSNYSKNWFPAEKKGYSGVAILSREEPLRVFKGIKSPDFDREGRVLSAEFKNYVFVSAYFPNSQDFGARLEFKIRFCDEILTFCNTLEAELSKPVILCGDFNIAHQPIDLARPKENESTAGYFPQERQWMGRFLESGWVDSFRFFYPQRENAYSWWSARLNARARNVGWRIDYHAVSPTGKKYLESAEIQDQVLGSDHCPVGISLKL
jgi:exodeoxyribonuclease-3